MTPGTVNLLLTVKVRVTLVLAMPIWINCLLLKTKTTSSSHEHLHCQLLSTVIIRRYFWLGQIQLRDWSFKSHILPEQKRKWQLVNERNNCPMIRHDTQLSPDRCATLSLKTRHLLTILIQPVEEVQKWLNIRWWIFAKVDPRKRQKIIVRSQISVQNECFAQSNIILRFTEALPWNTTQRHKSSSSSSLEKMKHCILQILLCGETTWKIENP